MKEKGHQQAGIIAILLICLFEPNESYKAYMYCWFDLNHFSWAGSDLSG